MSLAECKSRFNVSVSANLVIITNSQLAEMNHQHGRILRTTYRAIKYWRLRHEELFQSSSLALRK